MCFEVGKCCFCVDLESATRAIALVEAVVAIPLIVQGIAALSVGHLATGLLLFISSWVLFDGAFLGRKALLMGWMVATAAKSAICLGVGVVCAFLVNDANATEPDKRTGVLDALNTIGESYLSCCVFSLTNQKTLFYVVYSIAFFTCGFVYMYCFAVVYSFRRGIKSGKDKKHSQSSYFSSGRHKSKYASSSSSKHRHHHRHGHNHHPKKPTKEYDYGADAGRTAETTDYGNDVGLVYL